MLGILLRCVAALVFLLAALDQTLFKQTPTELVAWGLFAWVLATLLDGFNLGTYVRRPPA